MNKWIVKLCLFTLLFGCKIGDVGSKDSSNAESTNVDNSTDNSENGITKCKYTCEPVDGGFRVVRSCEGSETEIGFDALPKGDSCIIVTPDGEPTGEVITTPGIINPAVS